MKKFGLLGKILCVILALALSAGALIGCGNSTGEPLLTLGETSISVNVYQLYLSRMKGLLCTTGYFGNSATVPSFWENLYNVEERKTYNDIYTEIVLEDTKTYLAILYEFDQAGLELPQSTIDEIEKEIQALIDADANGSLNAFNSILSEYGANYDVLREAAIIEAKMKYFSEYKFGANGEKMSPLEIENYYKENYVRFRQIFLASYVYVYEEDVNGDKIYFKTGTNKISYDTDQATKLKDDGSYETDKNGDRIYYYTDESGKERIAYKKEGAETRYKYDEDNNPITREFTDAEMKILNSDADAIMAEAKVGDTVGFDALVDVYNQDETNEKYPNGHYVSKTMDYDVMDVIKEAMNLEIGQMKKVESEYGIHIIMRYELEDDGYMLEENEEFFINKTTGTYSFMPDLIDESVYNFVKANRENIVIDTALLEGVDIKNAGVNYYY